MKTIFESNSVVVLGCCDEMTVTVKTSNGGALHSLGHEIMRLKQEVERLERVSEEQYEMLNALKNNSKLVVSNARSSSVRKGLSLSSEPQHYRVPLHVINLISNYISLGSVNYDQSNNTENT